MLFTKFSLMAVAAAGVFAQPPTATAALDTRDGEGEACASAVLKNSAALNAMPTANSDVEKAVATATFTSDCQIPAVTGDKASAYSSYWSEASSWQDKYKTEWSNVVSACSKDLDQVFKSASATEANPFAGITACSSLSWAPAQTTGSEKGAGTRQTGATVAVIALAGFAAAALF